MASMKISGTTKPLASECSQQPKTDDAKEIAKASVELKVDAIFDFMEGAGNRKVSASVSAGGIQWQLCVESSAADDGEIHVGFSLGGSHEDGAWSQWVTADFFVFDSSDRDWCKLGGVSETMIGSTPLPSSAGDPRLFCNKRMRDAGFLWFDWFDPRGPAKFRVDFACWKDSFQQKGDLDDVTFIVEGRPVYANKGYITYISPVLRTMLTGGFKEAQSDEVHITQTSAEDFVTFMQALAPLREPVTDANVYVLYGLADVYDVEFLRRDCEKHLIAMKGIEAVDKILLAQSLNRAEFITRLVGSLNQADLELIEDDDREEEFSEETRDQLRERDKHLGFVVRIPFPFNAFQDSS